MDVGCRPLEGRNFVQLPLNNDTADDEDCKIFLHRLVKNRDNRGRNTVCSQ